MHKTPVLLSVPKMHRYFFPACEEQLETFMCSQRGQWSFIEGFYYAVRTMKSCFPPHIQYIQCLYTTVYSKSMTSSCVFVVHMDMSVCMSLCVSLSIWFSFFFSPEWFMNCPRLPVADPIIYDWQDDRLRLKWVGAPGCLLIYIRFTIS